MRPVPVGVEPALKSYLDDVSAAILQLQNPGKPANEFAVAFASLPPPENYKNCRCTVTDKNCIAISTNVSTVWTWLRADGTAI